jgi:hypothetical protein
MKARKEDYPPLIYVVRSVDCGRYKIGYASDWNGRLNALRSNNPSEVEVCRLIAGSRAIERVFKYSPIWQKYHVRGEWYRDCDLIRMWIRSTAKYELRKEDNEKARPG